MSFSREGTLGLRDDVLEAHIAVVHVRFVIQEGCVAIK